MRRLLYIPRKVIKFALLTVVCGVVVFFALVRTQVGRDGLRDQIERSFQSQFEGRLRIGQLTGNLVQTLFARDVRLFDPDGRLVLAVDSVRIEPRWRDVLRQTISVGDLTLIRPHLHLLRDEDGAWNLADVFRRDRADTTRASPWAFTSAEVRLVDGAVSTYTVGALPKAVVAGRVFNYAEATLINLDASATVDWRPEVKQIDLLGLSARLVEPEFGLDDIHGQVLFEDGGLAFNQFSIEAEGSRLALSGRLDGPPGARTYDLTLDQSRLAFEPIRRLVPPLPLADAVALDARLRGPLDALVIETMTLDRGRSHLAADGTLLGLPDSLDFELSFRDNRVYRRDVRRVWPGFESRSPLDSLRFTVFTKGMLPLGSDRPLHAEAFVDVATGAGAIRGTVRLDRPRAAPPTYFADLETIGLNLAELLPEAPPSRLTGHFALEGSGFTADDLDATLTGGFEPSLFAGRFVDSLRLDLVAARRAIEGRIDLLQSGGVLTAGFALNTAVARPTLRLDARLRGFDVGPLLLNDSLTTDLNLALRLNAAGIEAPNLSGTLDVEMDSSNVTQAGRRTAVPPNRFTARLTPRYHDGPRFTFAGDVAEVRLEGDFPVRPLLGLGRLWMTALAEAFRAETAKPYPPVLVDGTPDIPEAPPPDPVLREAVRAALVQSGIDSTLTIDLHIALGQTALLAALVPRLPPLHADLAGSFRLSVDADRFALEGGMAGDTLSVGGLRVHAPQTHFRAAASLDAALPRTLDAALSLDTDSLRLGTLAIRSPRFLLSFRDRQATLIVDADPQAQVGPLHLDASLDLRSDRNRLTLHDLLVAAGNYTWTLTEPARIDLFDGATMVPSFTLASNGPTPALDQRLRVRGTLSDVPSDTLFAEAEAIVLRQLSDFFSLRRRVGGRLDGQVALTGGTRAPRFTGRLQVAAASLDANILGDLTLESRFVPGSPDVGLDLRLTPSAMAAPAVIHGTDVPARLLDNRLRLTGTFRLPRADEDGNRIDPGAWDLSLDAERADLFYFSDYIFPSVLARAEGFSRGTGHIGGTISFPLFSADMDIVGGRFDVPQFNTAYALEGPVTVDDDAIRIQGARLTDETGGSAILTGDVNFNEYRFFSFDLAGVLDALQIMDVVSSDELPFYGRLWGSGTVTLTGPVYNTLLRSADAVTTPESELFIPVTEEESSTDAGFFVFADSSGTLPDLGVRKRRKNLLAQRPVGERPFLDGMDLDLSIFAPSGSTVHLVIDPLLGDVINAVGSGRVQLQRREGEFLTFGTFEVDGGDYLFTAGEVFVRRFLIEEGGTLTFDGDPLNARMNIPASYRTRASRAGLPPLPGSSAQSLIPLTVRLNISGRVSTPVVGLSLAIDRNNQNVLGDYQGLEALLNQPERATEYATSVLLTNSFRLTTTNIDNAAGGTLAFNSVSQLVSSQLNRFLSQALPNVDFSFGVQGENAQDIDVTYGVALRLLDERLIIRGEGVFQGSGSADNTRTQQSLQGEFVVEVRLSPNISVEVFYRRESDVLIEDAALTNTAGAGLSYQTEFTTWRRFLERVFGWLLPGDPAEEPPPPPPITDGS